METDPKALLKKYYLKEMELNSLLEITQAINNNLDEEALLKIYEFTIRANLNISKLVLFLFEDEWQCKVDCISNLNHTTDGICNQNCFNLHGATVLRIL